MSNNIAQDNIVSTEQRYKNARRILEAAILEEARRKEAERRSLRPTSIWPSGTFNTEDIPQGPDNWLYNALSDPKLNKGLETLAGNAADIILGIESGNPVVDLGTSNIPGVGAASILAAGGMPGLVDAVGIGELKNMKRIPKYTYEFVKEFFGDKGLQNLDNALTKYPKAGKPSVNDARYILNTGMGGEKVKPIKPYSSGDVTLDMDMAVGAKPGRFKEYIKEMYSNVISMANDNSTRKLADRGYRTFEEGVEKNDIKKISAARTLLAHMENLLEDRAMSNVALNRLDKIISENTLPVGQTFNFSLAKEDNPEAYKNMRRIAALADEPVQDWETIARKQELKDARDIKKQAKKQEKEQQKQAKQTQQMQQNKNTETPKEQPKSEQPIQAEVKPEVKETPKGGPNMWRENGWDPNIRGDVFYGKFGGNLSDESKRDAFVMDSLANYWARQIVGEGKEGKLSEAEIFDAKDRADARHKRSNYDEVSQGFYNDIKKNIESGNMPGKSVMFGPKYKKNVRTYRDTPTLILKPEEKPKYYDDIRIWADEQDGPDIYEILFRPEVDKRLNKLNEAYWLYNNSKR